MERFSNKIVLVTGASRGIGKAIAERFAAEKAKVALISNDNRELDETSQSLKTEGAEVLSIVADVADEKSDDAAFITGSTLLVDGGQLAF